MTGNKFGWTDEQKADAKALGFELEKIGLSLPCQRPITATRVNQKTGEIQELSLRCNTRKARICPSCAALYRGDVNSIMREGIHTAMGEGDAVVFLTLTAPSFGRTHFVPPPAPARLSERRRAAWDRRYSRKCGCGVSHKQGDKCFQGVPVDLGEYRYRDQVKWNEAAGRLWSRTADELTRILDVRDRDGKLLRLPYVAIAEWQSRGAIHLHVIARVPKNRVPLLDPVAADERGSGTKRLARFEEEAKAVSTTVDGKTYSWGTQCVAEVVSSERSMVRTAGYLAKVVGYAVKDLTTDLGSEVAHSPEAAAHHKRLHAAAARVRCGQHPSVVRASMDTPEELWKEERLRRVSAPADETEIISRLQEAERLGDAAVEALLVQLELEEAERVKARLKESARFREQSRWLMCEHDQMNRSEQGSYGCPSQRHQQWGWRGHTMRRSRSWSVLNMTGCREARRKFHDSEQPEETEFDPVSGEPVESPWVWQSVTSGERADWEKWQALLL